MFTTKYANMDGSPIGFHFIRYILRESVAFCIVLITYALLSTYYTVNADVVTNIGNIGIRPNAIAYNTDNQKIYVANYGYGDCDSGFFASVHSGSITTIDKNYNIQKVRMEIPGGTIERVEDCLSGIAFNSHNKRIYVTTGGDDSVFMVHDLRVEGDIIGVDDNPKGIAFNPADMRIYTANSDDDDISVILDIIVQKEIEFDDTRPVALAFNPANQRMYVTNSETGTVSTIGKEGDVVNIPTVIGKEPSGIAYSEINQKMYVTVKGDDKVVMIKDHNVEPVSIGVGKRPTGIAYNEANGNMYVANSGSGTVSIIDRNDRPLLPPLSPLEVGLDPHGIAYNRDDNKIYVANSGDDSVSVISPTP
jgi:DNA-binding beta-propeller fold protein YncE